MFPRKILTRSGLISLNTARQSHLNAVCCCCSRQVNTARPKGNPETELEDLVRLNSPENKKVTRARKTWYKAAVKLQDQFDDEKRAGAELT
ncbi:hypothetical protein Tco_0163826 [Tanacetum coccineum]